MRRVIAVVSATILCAGAAFATPGKISKVDRSLPESMQSEAFDGSWAFEATTTAGNCPALLPTNIAIKDSRIVEAAGIRAAAWGYVENDGAIVTRFTDEAHVSRFYGHLRGASGSGAWSSGSDYCGGTWRASRRGAADHAAR